MATFLDNFEDGILHEDPWWHKIGSGSVSIVNDPTGKSSKVARMYLPTQLYASNINAKAQIEYNPAYGYVPGRYAPWFTSAGYRFAIYVSANYKNDPHSESVSSLHQSSSDPVWGGISAPFGMKIESNSKIRISLYTGAERDVNSRKGSHYWDLFTIQAGHWHYFVINTHWDYRAGNTNGFHKVYAKVDSPPTTSDIILDYVGPTGFNYDKTCYPYCGVYVWDWTEQENVDESLAAGVTYREYFFDDISYKDDVFILEDVGPSIPSAPSDMTVTGVTDSSITASWNDNSNDEDGFRLEHSDLGVNWDYEILPANSTTYELTGLGTGVSKHFRVRSYNIAGSSTYSNIDTGMTQAVQPVDFTEDFESTLTNPPWSHLGDGTVTSVANPSGSGNVTKMTVPAQLYASGSDALASSYFEGDVPSGVDKFMKPFEEWGVKFKLYIPAGWIPDPSSEAIFKMINETYQTGLTFLIDQDTFRIKVQYNTDPIPANGTNISINQEIGVVGLTGGQWYHYIINTKWNYTAGNPDGYHNVYMKIGAEPTTDDLIYNYSGSTGCADTNAEQTCFQIHKWPWANQTDVDASINAGITERTYYYDDYFTQNSAIVVFPPTQSTTHINAIQGLLSTNAGGLATLVTGDVYREDTQIIFPPNTELDCNLAVIEPFGGLLRSEWDGSLHNEQYIFLLKDGSTIKDGDADGLNKTGWGGINSNGANNIRIENVTTSLFRFSCMFLYNCTNVVVHNNRFWESSIQPAGSNWESTYLFWNFLYNADISYNEFSGVDGAQALAGGGIDVKFNSDVFGWTNVDIHHNTFNLNPKHGWVNPVSGDQGANYALEINKNFNGTGLKFRNNISNCGVSLMRKNVTTDLNNDAYLADNRFVLGNGASLGYEFENVNLTVERDYMVGASYTFGYFGKVTVPNYTRELIVKHSIFHLGGANNPQLLFANGGQTTGYVLFERCTIYCEDNPTQLFNNNSSIGNTLQNYNMHKCILVNKTGTAIPISNAPKSNWDISDNKFEGNWNLQEWTNNDMVSNALAESGAKPDAFYTSNYAGYGADITGGAAPTIPADPTGLTIDSATASSIRVTWQDNSNDESGFTLEHSPVGTHNWTAVNLAPNTETYNHTGLSAEQTVYYRVKSYNDAGSSAYTSVEQGTTSPQGSVDIFTEIFDTLSYDPPWTSSGLGLQELSPSQKVVGNNSLRLYLEAVKGIYDGVNSRTQVEYNPSGVPAKYPSWNTSTGQSFAVYIPSNMEVNDQFTTLIYSQAQAPSTVFTSAEPFSIYLQGGYFRITHRTAPVQSKSSIVTVDNTQVMTLEAGNWYYFIINSHWDYAGAGFHKVYLRKGAPPQQTDNVIDYNGATGYNDNKPETVSTWFTNYKWDWGNDANVQLSWDAGITGSELFFDDILIQNDVIDVPLGGGQGPIIPSNLRVTDRTTSQLTVAWNDNSTDEDNFILSHSPTGSEPWTEIIIQSNTTSYPHSGLAEGQTVYYKIRSVNANGSSADTSVIWDTTDTTTANVFTDDFELVSTNPPWRDDVGQNPPTRDNTYKLSGTYSQRFYIPVSTNWVDPRSQKQFQGDATSGVTWYVPHPLPANGYTRGFSVAIYIPADFQPDLWNEYLLQHKNSPDPGLSGLDNNPSWAFGIRGKNYSTGTGLEWYCTIRTIAPNPTSDPNDKVTIGYDNVADVIPGQWHYFVVNTHWNYRSGSNGYHKVYMKTGSPPTVEDLVLDYNGPTGYNSEYHGSVYLNIYKWPWQDSNNAQASIDAWNAAGVPANEQKREVWFDDFRMQESAIAVPTGGTAPDPPSSMTLDVVTRTSISMSWQDNSSDETSFTLSFSADGSNWADIVLNANTTTFQHNGLGGEETYYYKVRADNASGSSVYSNTINATTLPDPVTGWKYRRAGKNIKGTLLIQSKSIFS